VTIGSLFSGIGGLELGLESCGLGPIKWQCEIDPYACAVLAKHWPTVRRYEDVRTIDETVERVDVICGGFPCQDISSAGLRAGIGGKRSGLWGEYARIVRILRPSVVFVENVADLVARGIDRVLGDLAALGYDAEWGCFRASDAGAHHERDRAFVLAYSDGNRLEAWRREAATELDAQGGIHAQSGAAWLSEPELGRVVNGFPRPVDRTKCLGNAVVPQQAALAWRELSRRAGVILSHAEAMHLVQA
jgi:DNA (cytosine-5)-methyltransferase 1